MADIRSKISQTNRIRSNLNQNPKVAVKTVALGSKVSISQIEGLDVTGASDGAVLLYSGSEEKFKATTTMDNPNTIISGGGF